MVSRAVQQRLRAVHPAMRSQLPLHIFTSSILHLIITRPDQAPGLASVSSRPANASKQNPLAT